MHVERDEGSESQFQKWFFKMLFWKTHGSANISPNNNTNLLRFKLTNSPISHSNLQHSFRFNFGSAYAFQNSIWFVHLDSEFHPNFHVDSILNMFEFPTQILDYGQLDSEFKFKSSKLWLVCDYKQQANNNNVWEEGVSRITNGLEISSGQCHISTADE